jgi:hypothetical protein
MIQKVKIVLDSLGVNKNESNIITKSLIGLQARRRNESNCIDLVFYGVGLLPLTLQVYYGWLYSYT